MVFMSEGATKNPQNTFYCALNCLSAQACWKFNLMKWARCGFTSGSYWRSNLCLEKFIGKVLLRTNTNKFSVFKFICKSQ